MKTSSTLLILASALLVGSLAACALSVPADPGENARLRARPATEASLTAAGPGPDARAHDPVAETLYATRCGTCHALYPPRWARAADWPIFVARYAPRAGLFGADRARVLRWLQANSS